MEEDYSVVTVCEVSIPDGTLCPVFSLLLQYLEVSLVS